MATPNVEVRSEEDGYGIAVDGVVSEMVGYGEPVELEVDGVLYIGYVEVDEKGDLATPLPEFVFTAKPVDAKVVEVDGEGEEAPESGESDGDGSDPVDDSAHEDNDEE